MNAVLLLSSGLDSAANLVLPSPFKVKLALTFNYGQRSAAKELLHAAKLARFFEVEHEILDLSKFANWVGDKSGLLNQEKLPSPSNKDLDDLAITQETARAVWVPNRNGVLLSLAAAIAEARGLDAVAVGFNAEEAVTFADNSKAYMEAMTASLRFSTANHVQVVSSTVDKTKAEIVQKLSELGFPFEHLWSCYESGGFHCGECESCKRLKRAVKLGIVNDGQRKRVIGDLFCEIENQA